MSRADDFRRKTEANVAENRKEFEGEYSDAIQALSALSDEDVKKITPEIKIRQDLIDVVTKATEANESQAAIAQKIRDLGDTAVSLAKKVPKLAALLA